MTDQLRQKQVTIVDSDEKTQSELEARVRLKKYDATSFLSAESLLSSAVNDRTCTCVVSEFNLPGMSGLELQSLLSQQKVIATMVFFVESPQCGDIVRAMQSGAANVVEKSSGYGLVVAAIDNALVECEKRLSFEIERRDVLDQLNALTDDERQVLSGILDGHSNKEIAKDLTLSLRTIETRRSRVFRKLHVHHPALLAKKVLYATDPSFERS